MLRQLQKALALARCIRFTAEYDDASEVDIPDALAGLLDVLERAALLLDTAGDTP